MPYCPNCGTKNEEGAETCVNCGASLYDRRRRHGRRDGCYGSRDEEHQEECFGLPHGSAIVGILFGVAILILAVAWILSLTLGISINLGVFVGPIVALIVAILLIAGAIYQLRRRP